MAAFAEFGEVEVGAFFEGCADGVEVGADFPALEFGGELLRIGMEDDGHFAAATLERQPIAARLDGFEVMILEEE